MRGEILNKEKDYALAFFSGAKYKLFLIFVSIFGILQAKRPVYKCVYVCENMFMSICRVCVYVYVYIFNRTLSMGSRKAASYHTHMVFLLHLSISLLLLMGVCVTMTTFFIPFLPYD